MTMHDPQYPQHRHNTTSSVFLFPYQTFLASDFTLFKQYIFGTINYEDLTVWEVLLENYYMKTNLQQIIIVKTYSAWKVHHSKAATNTKLF